MIFQDFLTNGLGGDLIISNGDFVIGPSDYQNQYDIINDTQGYWKEYPNLGVGLILQQNGNVDLTQLSSLIMNQLNNDGFTTRSPKITFDSSGDLNIVTNAYRS